MKILFVVASTFCLVLTLMLLPWGGLESIATVEASASNCPLTYTILPVSLTTEHGFIFQASAASESDMWAVGYAWNDSVIESGSLALHWNGASWSAIPTQDGEADAYMLTSVEVVSPTDVWAVGEQRTPQVETLAKHWDGSEWSEVPTPNGEGAASLLAGVAGAVSNDVWAIGGSLTGDVIEPLLLNWDGSEWSDVTSELPGGTTAFMRRIVARSQDEVWILRDGPTSIGLIRWDGEEWALAAEYTPPVGVVSFNATDMIVLDEDDVRVTLNSDILQASEATRSARQVLHWNGSDWQIDYTDAGKPRTFEAMGAVGADDIWAVGTIRRTLRMTQDKFKYLQDAAHWEVNAWHKENTIFYARGTRFVDVIPFSSDSVWLFANTGDSGSGGPPEGQPAIAHGILPCMQIPGQVVLKSPPDRAHVPPPGPRFNWNNLPNTQYYELTVNLDQPGGKEVVHQYLVKSSYEQTVELTGSNFFYWKVRACNNAGCGPWSDSRYFKYK